MFYSIINQSEPHLQVTTYSSVQKELDKTMDMVCDDHECVIITRRNGSPVVLLSLEEYQSLSETTFL